MALKLQGIENTPQKLSIDFIGSFKDCLVTIMDLTGPEHVL